MDLPHSVEAENGVIGSTLIDNALVGELGFDSLDVEAFHITHNRVIWGHVLKLIDNDQPIALHTLTEALRVSGELEDIGGVARLIGIMDGVEVASLAPEYLNTVLERYRQRRLIEGLGRCINKAYALQDSEEILDDVEGVLASEVKSVDIADTALELAARYATNEALIPTGIPTLDRRIGGITRGDVTLIAARKSVGKTAFATMVAQHMAQQVGGWGLYLVPDQPLPELYALEASRISGVPLNTFYGEANEESKDIYLKALHSLPHGFLRHIRFRPGAINLKQVRTESLRAIRRGAKFIFLDTVNRVSFVGQNKVEMLAHLGSLMKEISTTYDIPFIGLAQLRREVETEKRKPTENDIADAPGTLGNDANTILILDRERQGHMQNIMNIIVAKAKAAAAGAGVIAHCGFRPEFAQVVPSVEIS